MFWVGKKGLVSDLYQEKLVGEEAEVSLLDS